MFARRESHVLSAALPVGDHIDQVLLVLRHEGLGQCTWRGAERNLQGRIRPHLAPDHGGIDPLDHSTIDSDHGQRKGVLRHSRPAAGKDRTGDHPPRLIERTGTVTVGIGYQSQRGGFHDVAILDPPLAADVRRIGRHGIGRKFDGAQREDEKPRATTQRLVGFAGQTERSIEPPRFGQIHQRDLAVFLDHHNRTRGRDAVAGLDCDRLPARIVRHRHAQTLHHARSAGRGKIVLALADIVLVAREVGAGQHPSIEIARPSPQAVQHQRGSGKQFAQFAMRKRASRLAAHDLRCAERFGNVNLCALRSCDIGGLEGGGHG